jgi:hypothetical protein
MRHIIIINGFKESGKDLFMEYLGEISSLTVFKRSWVDKVKEIAKRDYNWDGTKTLENRKLLANLADSMDDTCFNDVTRYTTNSLYDDYIYCICARRPKDIARIRDYFNFRDNTKTYTVLIRRAEVENKEQSNSADSEIFNYWYEHQVNNNSTKEDFKTEVEFFYNKIFNKV